MQHGTKAAKARQDWFAGFRINADFAVSADFTAVDAARLFNQFVKWRVESIEHGTFGQISGGDFELTRDQVQQLALARIVLANPHAVILDESTTQLELVDATESLRAVLADRAVLIISHDARIASLADRAVLLEDGKITAEGTPTEIFELT